MPMGGLAGRNPMADLQTALTNLTNFRKKLPKSAKPTIPDNNLVGFTTKVDELIKELGAALKKKPVGTIDKKVFEDARSIIGKASDLLKLDKKDKATQDLFKNISMIGTWANAVATSQK
jgi:hypothetical protein